MTYSEKLKDPRWQQKRLEVMQSAGFKCQMCGDAESTLHIHHVNYRKGAKPWEYELHELKCFCEHCHEQVEINISLARTICCEVEHGNMFTFMWRIRMAYARALAIGADDMILETLSLALRIETSSTIISDIQFALSWSEKVDWKQLEEQIIDTLGAKGER